MTKRLSNKSLIALIVILAVLFVTGTTYAIFAYRNTKEKQLYTETILLNTTFRDYYLVDLENLEMGSQVTGSIQFKKESTSADSYVRLYAAFEFDKSKNENFVPTGNQQKWLDIANATLVSTITSSDYLWSQSYGGYYYLLNPTSVQVGSVYKNPMLVVTDDNIIYELTKSINIPSDIILPTETMDLVLKLKIEAIQADYIYGYIHGSLDETGNVFREEIAPLMNEAFGVTPVEKVVFKYVTNGGSSIETLVYNVGETILLPDVVTTKRNYVFDAWYSDSSCTIDYEYENKVGKEHTFTENVSIYAKWIEGQIIDFRFADNEGNNGVNFSNYANTFTLNEISLPKINYGRYTLVFFENSDLSGKIYFPDTIYPTTPSILYAAWFYIGSDCYEISGNTIIDYTGNYHSLIIPDNLNLGVCAVTGRGLFANQNGKNTILKRIVLPGYINTSMQGYNIPDYAFANCEVLENIIVNAPISGVGNASFIQCKALTDLQLAVIVPTGNTHFIIGKSAFEGCERLNLVLEENAVQVYNNSLYGQSVTIKTEAKDFIIKDATSGANTSFTYASGNIFKIYVRGDYFWSFYDVEEDPRFVEAVNAGQLRSLETYDISVLLNDEVYSAYIDVRKGEEIELLNTYQNSYYTVSGGGGEELPDKFVLGDQSYRDYLDLNAYDLNYIYAYSGEYFLVTFRFAENSMNDKVTKFGTADIDNLRVKSYKGVAALPIIEVEEDNGKRFRLVWFDDYKATSTCFYETNLTTVLEDRIFYGVWFYIKEFANNATVNYKYPETGDDASFCNVIYTTPTVDPDTYTVNKVLANGQSKNLRRIILCDKVNNIASNAFYGGGSYNISFVYACGRILGVGENSFNSCTNLASINLLGVVNIRKGAFQNCKNLVTVNVNEREFTGEVGDYAFDGCTALKELLFAYVEKVGNFAFRNCSSLTSPVDVGEKSSKEECSIGRAAFLNCRNISFIKLGPKLKKLGGGAFYNCKNVRRVTIYSNIQTTYSIDGYDKSQVNLTAPKTDGTFNDEHNHPFGNCGDNEGFILDIRCENIPAYMFYTNYDNTTYSKASYTPKTSVFNGPKIISIEFNTSNIIIGQGAFEGLQTCSQLVVGAAAVVNPNTGVIEKEEVRLNSITIGLQAFREAKGLISVELYSDSITIGQDAFTNCTKLCYAKKSSSSSATLNSTGLYSEDTELTSSPTVTLRQSKNSAYWVIDNGKNDIVLIGINYFAKKVTMDTEKYSEDAEYILTPTMIANEMAINNKHLNEIVLSCTVGNSSFKNCVELVDVKFSSCVFIQKYIGEYAFQNCTELTSVYFDASDSNAMTFIEIRKYAFQNCIKLLSFGFPENLKTIHEGAFESCKSFYVVNFGSELITIGNNAFRDCTSLTIINMLDNVETIGENCFENCTRLVSIKFSQSLRIIGKKAFYNCVTLGTADVQIGEDEEGNPIMSLPYVELPASLAVDGLQEQAFYSTPKLKQVKILKNDECLDYFHKEEGETTYRAESSAFEANALEKIYVYAYVFGDYLDTWATIPNNVPTSHAILSEPKARQDHRNFELIDPSGYSKPWDGTEVFLRGSGTTADPYLIASGKHMQYFNTRVLRYSEEGYLTYKTGEYSVKCNIDLNNQAYLPTAYHIDEWLDGDVFCGVFNGNKFTFKNLKFAASGPYGAVQIAGLFGMLGAYGGKTTTINDVIVHYNNAVTGAANFGGVVGYVSNLSTYGNVKIQGCQSKGDVTLTVQMTPSSYFGGTLYFGGIIGMTPMERSVDRCISDLNMYLSQLREEAYVGGVSGMMAGSIANCGNSGSIEAYSTARLVVGGIIGDLHGNVDACFNTGDIYAESSVSSDDEDYGRVLVGGIAGYTNYYDYVYIRDCYNTGTIEGVASYSVYNSTYGTSGVEANIGGIIGMTKRTTTYIQRVYNLGDIIGESVGWASNVGGLGGNCYSSISYAISQGEVKNYSSSYWGNRRSGSICGYTAGGGSFTNIRTRYNCADGSERFFMDGSGTPTTFNNIKTFGRNSNYSTNVWGGNVVDLHNTYGIPIDIEFFYDATFDIMTNFSTDIWLFQDYAMPTFKWIALAM